MKKKRRHRLSSTFKSTRMRQSKAQDRYNRNTYVDNKYYKDINLTENRRYKTRFELNRVFNDYLIHSDDPAKRRKKKIDSNIKADFAKMHRKRLIDMNRALSAKIKLGIIDSDRIKTAKKQLKLQRREVKELRRIEVCHRRKRRREALFSFKLIGRGKGGSKEHKWTNDSYEVRC